VEEPSDDDLLLFTRTEAVLVSLKGVFVDGEPLFVVLGEE